MCRPYRAWDFCWSDTRAFSPGYHIAGLRPFRFGGLVAREVVGGQKQVMSVGLLARDVTAKNRHEQIIPALKGRDFGLYIKREREAGASVEDLFP